MNVGRRGNNYALQTIILDAIVILKRLLQAAAVLSIKGALQPCVTSNQKDVTVQGKGDTAKFRNKSIMFEKYNFGFRSIFFGPISVHFEYFILVYGSTDPDAHTA